MNLASLWHPWMRRFVVASPESLLKKNFGEPICMNDIALGLHHRISGVFTDILGARDWMKRVCGPHELMVKQQSSLRFVHSGDTLGSRSTAIGCIEYGTDVNIGIDHSCPLDSYSISLPLTGEQELHTQASVIGSDPESGLIIDPAARQELWISGNCCKLLVAINRTTMKLMLEQMLGRAVDAPIAFEPKISLSESAAQTWWRWVRLLWEDMGHRGNLMHYNDLAQDVEASLIRGLLSFQPHNYSVELAAVSRLDIPPHVSRLAEALTQHAREDVDVDVLISSQGINKGRAVADFRANLGVTPLQFLRQYRLQQVRLEIIRNASSRYISEIALNWGFSHLGRFSQAYREAFGEAPSVTAERNRQKNWTH